jgi:hypothetical protein
MMTIMGLIPWVFIIVWLFDFDLYAKLIAWRRNIHRRRVRELERERRAYVLALERYADPGNWIGYTFVGAERPEEPAEIALRAHGRLGALQELPRAHIAGPKPE